MIVSACVYDESVPFSIQRESHTSFTVQYRVQAPCIRQSDGDGNREVQVSGRINQLAREGGDPFRHKADGENFPVALRILPRACRNDLMALYAYARRVDDVGDAAAGDRLRSLDILETQLDELFAGGRPDDPAVAGLAGTIREHGLRRDPFVRLIEANRRDQQVVRYGTFGELLDYCALSANPVGELVLGVFGATTERHRDYSDQVCTALQILEHCQDIAEDHTVGRVYLPGEDMAYFGVTERELAGDTASRQLRALIGFQVQRAVGMLDEGVTLLRTLPGAARLAIAGYIGGGLATAGALTRARFDVLAATPRPTKMATAGETMRLLTGAMR